MCVLDIGSGTGETAIDDHSIALAQLETPSLEQGQGLINPAKSM